MNTSFEEQIRERAYQIWLAGGMSEGLAHEHWVSAEQAVIGESAEPTTSVADASIIKKTSAGATAVEPTRAKTTRARTTKVGGQAKAAPRAKSSKAGKAAH